jgi:Methyltransferase domain
VDRPTHEKSDRERVGHLGRSTNAHLQLIPLIKKYGWRRGAEIGVLRGKTFFALLDACPDLHMIGVDQWRVLPFREDECAETYQGFPMARLRNDVISRASSYNRHSATRATILEGDSAEMAANVADASLDFVFIDGDHTEAGFERDLLAWAPKVHLNGLVTGHDWNWPTVQAVLQRRCPGWQGLEDAVWVCERRKVLVT